MTMTLFISLFTGGAVVTGLFTEAIKKYYQNANKKYSANAIALVNAIVIGVCGTLIAYTLLGVELTMSNIVCIPLMAICVWITAILGYDKVSQTLEQLKDIF